jgi:hypothetical protein
LIYLLFAKLEETLPYLPCYFFFRKSSPITG